MGFVAGARVVSATPAATSESPRVWDGDHAAAEQLRAETAKQQERKRAEVADKQERARAEVADQQERARAEVPAMAPTSDPKLEALRALAKR